MTVRGGFVALVAGFIVACASSGEPGGLPGISLPGDPVALEAVRAPSSPQSTLAWYSGYEEPARLVIRTPETWAEAWERVWQPHSPVPSLPPVDFEAEMVVLVAMGTQRRPATRSRSRAPRSRTASSGSACSRPRRARLASPDRR